MNFSRNKKGFKCLQFHFWRSVLKKCIPHARPKILRGMFAWGYAVARWSRMLLSILRCEGYECQFLGLYTHIYFVIFIDIWTIILHVMENWIKYMQPVAWAPQQTTIAANSVTPMHCAGCIQHINNKSKHCLFSIRPVLCGSMNNSN